ncbi:Wadjet anti-phage system protein JetD domain-containing protein [Aliivibrio fischeri]|uniref:Wadjet protein JetD C-terminal domain-containing protein n=1 Tax=Aliivibrio fischeri TaxID=668 RepID=A0A510UEE4_ALIFS|nr:Wadjet anti-phage system protein JetD domain-containing protein [Aliivibrio fischeri]GEK12917.1 hypothetical protein AFI02nite_09530 [Aliivibrio fischeri]
MKLNQYLTKISQGKTINLDRFIVCLPHSDFNEWRKIYSATRVRGGYNLTILDEKRHKELFEPEISNRVSASYVGRSHDFSSNYAHILVLNRITESQIPFVVVSHLEGYKTEGKLIGKKAVLIENIENFYRYREFLEFIGHSSMIDSCDIIFGSGNQICHHLNHPFLSSYDELYCAQDVELGGLTIYKTLKASLPQSNWLAPSDWEVFRNKFKLKPKNSTHLEKAIQLARDLELNTEADLMNQTRSFLEQEALLPELSQD